MKIFSFLSVSCAAFLCASATFAQEPTATDEAALAAQERVLLPGESISAIVNDKVITTFDVRQRMKLMLISAGGRIPPEALPQLQQQALRDLVEEKLKLAEAEKFELEIPSDDIRKEIETIGAQSNLSYAQLVELLTAEGISLSSLEEQIRSSLAWPSLVQGRFSNRIRVSDDEVEDTLARMKEDASNEQYLVSEICIPVDDPSQAQRFYQGGLQLIEQMRRGVPFAAVAQQFSACTTAAVGGDLGWVRAGELPAELDGAIRELPVGAVTNPIPSEGAFMILAVRDRREAKVAGEKTYTLAYASADASIGEDAARDAFDQLSTADACSGRALRIDLGEGIGVALLENVTLDLVDERFQDEVAQLRRGDISKYIEADNAFHAAYACDVDEGLGLPSRASIENRIFSRQLSRIGQQYLRDLERRATVDIRADDAANNG